MLVRGIAPRPLACKTRILTIKPHEQNKIWTVETLHPSQILRKRISPLRNMTAYAITGQLLILVLTTIIEFLFVVKILFIIWQTADLNCILGA
jgi:hypothetical protein